MALKFGPRSKGEAICDGGIDAGPVGRRRGCRPTPLLPGAICASRTIILWAQWRVGTPSFAFLFGGSTGVRNGGAGLVFWRLGGGPLSSGCSMSAFSGGRRVLAVDTSLRWAYAGGVGTIGPGRRFISCVALGIGLRAYEFARSF